MNFLSPLSCVTWPMAPLLYARAKVTINSAVPAGAGLAPATVSVTRQSLSVPVRTAGLALARGDGLGEEGRVVAPHSPASDGYQYVGFRLSAILLGCAFLSLAVMLSVIAV